MLGRDEVGEQRRVGVEQALGLGQAERRDADQARPISGSARRNWVISACVVALAGDQALVEGGEGGWDLRLDAARARA